MFQQPTWMAWKIKCHSADEARLLERWLATRIDADRIWSDAARTGTGGVDQVQTVRHRLGDYFSAIRVLPDSEANPTAFQLVFQRRPEAGRFWKDLMVNILQEIEATPQKASICLESKGSAETAASVPGFGSAQ